MLCRQQDIQWYVGHNNLIKGPLPTRHRRVYNYTRGSWQFSVYVLRVLRLESRAQHLSRCFRCQDGIGEQSPVSSFREYVDTHTCEAW